jgi:hypothetical protein
MSKKRVHTRWSQVHALFVVNPLAMGLYPRIEPWGMRLQILFSFPNQSTNYQTNGPFPFQIKPQTTKPMDPFASKSNHKLPNPWALSLPNQTTNYQTHGPFPFQIKSQTTKTHGPFPFQIKPQTTKPMGPGPSKWNLKPLTYLPEQINHKLASN